MLLTYIGKVAARFEAQKQEDAQFAEQEEEESEESDKARSSRAKSTDDLTACGRRSCLMRSHYLQN